MRVVGCPHPQLSKNSLPLDFIEVFEKRSTRIFDIVGPLYKEGLSVTDIAEQTGLKRHSIWKSLQANKQKLRPQESVPFDRWRQGRGQTKARPPHGFCYFQGQVIKDPVEYPTLLLIQNLVKQGASISAIVARLDSKGIKSRMKKPWSYNVVKAIIGRIKSGVVARLASAAGEPENTKPIPRRTR